MTRRYFEHLNKINDSFTSKYNLNKLVFIQEFASRAEAIQAEKIVKGWKREKKINLIESINKEWTNLMYIE